ncbi:unnamed protein product [Calypogeia fissa]
MWAVLFHRFWRISTSSSLGFRPSHVKQYPTKTEANHHSEQEPLFSKNGLRSLPVASQSSPSAAGPVLVDTYRQR